MMDMDLLGNPSGVGLGRPGGSHPLPANLASPNAIMDDDDTGSQNSHRSGYEKANKSGGSTRKASRSIIPSRVRSIILQDAPILDIMQRVVTRMNPGSSLETVLIAIALYRAGAPFVRYLVHLFLETFTSELTISETDPIATDVLRWVAREVMARDPGTKAIVSSYNPTSSGYTRRELELEMLGRISLKDQTETQMELDYMPPVGRKLFWVGYRPFLLSRGQTLDKHFSSNNRERVDANGVRPNTITLRTLGWSFSPLQELITVCREYKKDSLKGMTSIFFQRAGGRADYVGAMSSDLWRKVSKTSRKLSTVDMDQEAKAEIVRDADYFYSEVGKNMYRDCGIPYRRGYLFYGPPGTGKTSMSFALAGHLNCNLYMIDLAADNVTDSSLMSLFHHLPEKCVVVMEDIDSAGIGRDRIMNNNTTPAGAAYGTPAQSTPGSTEDEDDGVPVIPILPRLRGRVPVLPNLNASLGPNAYNSHRAQEARNNCKVTLSGILNVIDGNAAQDGRLLIMTTNDISALEPALIRAGRIDKIQYFGHVKRDIAKGIFQRIIRGTMTANQYDFEKLEEMAAAFADKLPEDRFTPAEVQNYLQTCRGDAEKAVNEVEAWAGGYRVYA